VLRCGSLVQHQAGDPKSAKRAFYQTGAISVCHSLFVKQTPLDTEAPSAGSIRASFGNATFIPHFLLSRTKTEHEPFAKAPVVRASHLKSASLDEMDTTLCRFQEARKAGLDVLSIRTILCNG